MAPGTELEKGIWNASDLVDCGTAGALDGAGDGAGGAALRVREADLRGAKLGLANALAAGLMVAASLGLIYEGGQVGWGLTALGALVGAVFVAVSSRLLGGHDDMEWGALRGADARKAMLLLGVMTVHSLTEGVGLGVSFGGGTELGRADHAGDRPSQHPRGAGDQPRDGAARGVREAGGVLERLLQPAAAAAGDPRVPGGERLRAPPRARGSGSPPGPCSG